MYKEGAMGRWEWAECDGVGKEDVEMIIRMQFFASLLTLLHKCKVVVLA